MIKVKKHVGSYDRVPGQAPAVTFLVIALNFTGNIAALAGTPGDRKWVYEGG